MKTSDIIAVIGIVVAIILAYYGWTLLNQDFIISVNPMNGQIQQQGVLSTTVTVKGDNGYKNTVSLGAISESSGIVVSFTPPLGGALPAYTSNVLINVGTNVQVGTHKIEIKGQGDDGKEHSTYYTLTVLPPPTEKQTPTLTSTPISTLTPTSTISPPIDVKIKSPTYGEIVSVSTIISGTSSGELPKGQYMWVAINPEKAPGLWWPQGGRITPLNGQWDVQAWMGGDQDKGTKFKIIVISLDEEGDKYYLDYLAKGQKTGSYPGNPLPANVNILANISVTRQ
jgi:hypothetical protein